MMFSCDPGGLPPDSGAPSASREKPASSARKPLHDFDLPSWGSCKILRCRNACGIAMPSSANGGTGCRTPRAASPRDPVATSFDAEVEEGEINGEKIDEREVDDRRNLMSRYNSSTVHSLREAVTCVKLEAAKEPGTTSGRKNSEERGISAAVAAPQQSQEKKSSEEREDPAASKPWNLRKRRAACTEPQENGQRQAHNQIFVSAPEKKAACKDNLPQFSLALSKEDISEDLAKIFGAKPPKKRKRLQKVQKVLDKVFPGLWLSDIKRGSYRIANGKR